MKGREGEETEGNRLVAKEKNGKLRKEEENFREVTKRNIKRRERNIMEEKGDLK